MHLEALGGRVQRGRPSGLATLAGAARRSLASCSFALGKIREILQFPSVGTSLLRHSQVLCSFSRHGSQTFSISIGSGARVLVVFASKNLEALADMQVDAEGDEHDVEPDEISRDPLQCKSVPVGTNRQSTEGSLCNVSFASLNKSEDGA